MCGNQVRLLSFHLALDSCELMLSSLAWCELYLTLGTLFRRFENLEGNHLTDEDLAYNDYFSAQIPINATKFQVNAKSD